MVSGVADVIVTDGLTGNIALKLMEGVSQTLLGAVRDAAMASTRAKLGGALLRPALREVRDELDPEEQGGAYLLGLTQLGGRSPWALHAEGLRAGDFESAARRERGPRGTDPDRARAGRGAAQQGEQAVIRPGR